MVLAVTAGALLAQADTITGIARVVDGDTLEIGGKHIRIFGIDAPEARQTCEIQGAIYACGEAATFALWQLIADRPVICKQRDTDRNKRPVSVCRTGDLDVGAELVRQGWAVAYRRFSLDYVPVEDQARAAKRGVWAGTFTLP